LGERTNDVAGCGDEDAIVVRVLAGKFELPDPVLIAPRFILAASAVGNDLPRAWRCQFFQSQHFFDLLR
jgi:hypothetical protein